MASVSFFLRSKIATKESTIWCRFRDKNIDLSQPIPHLKVKLNEWKDGRCKSPSKKMFDTDVETINVQLSKLESAIIADFQNLTPYSEYKTWLKDIITPKAKTNQIQQFSENIIDFIDSYIELKKQNVTPSTIKKAKVVKQLLIRYVAYKRNNPQSLTNLLFKDLSNYFRNDFEKYCLEEQYKISTTYRNLKFVKMICNVAESFDIEIHKHVSTWKFEIEKASKNTPKSIYLTFEELDKIERTEMPFDYLNNAKHWLLIACYTGQRVSDYLNFTKSNIVEDSDGQKYLEFTQMKTNSKMKIPLLKKVQEVLDKRNGDFPRKISDVNLNLYIKEVCKIAGIDEMIFNGKVLSVKDENNIKRTRKVFASYPKHELVTSHIGRKSFATNFYEKIPTTYLLNFTGHKSEKQLLSYINKTEVEKAKSTAEIFANLGY